MTTPTTPHYGLNLLAGGGKLSDDGYKFGDRDRMLIDQLLALGAELHHHDGVSGSDYTPDTAPTLALEIDGGSFPAGVRIYYKYTLRSPSGLETGPSPENYVTTPAPVSSPLAASGIGYVTTGGALLPGQYYYRLSAYVAANTIETLAGNPAYQVVAGISSDNRVTFTLPALPAGADGFNVYRQRPGGGYYWITAIDMTGVTPPTTFTDDGSMADDCGRGLPQENRTGVGSRVVVSIPGATPFLPDGWTWVVYRSYTAGVYSNALAHWVVEETSEGSGDITTEWEDVGAATVAGAPPANGFAVSSPAKILLTNGAEVQGQAPMGAISGFPVTAVFRVAGDVDTGAVPDVFPVPWPQCTIDGVVAALGVGSSPSARPVIVDLLLSRDGDPFASLYSDPGDRPSIAIGDQVASSAVPDVAELVQGDLLAITVVQDGGGATPTDRDLVVVVSAIAYGYSYLSHPWA